MRFFCQGRSSKGLEFFRLKKPFPRFHPILRSHLPHGHLSGLNTKPATPPEAFPSTSPPGSLPVSFANVFLSHRGHDRKGWRALGSVTEVSTQRALMEFRWNHHIHHCQVCIALSDHRSKCKCNCSGVRKAFTDLPFISRFPGR